MATRRYRPAPQATPPGPAAGRAFVPADLARIRPRPVVLSRELVVEQLRGAASAAALLPTSV